MKITSIIRTHKRNDFLKECLASISCQSYSNWEIVIFDDRGDPSTQKIVSDFKKYHQDKRIVYMTSFTSYDLFGKSFLYQNFLSEGDIIFRIDDDDILPEYTFDKLLEIYTDESVDFSFGSCCTFEDKTKNVTKITYNKSPLEVKTKSAWTPYTIPDNNPWINPWHWTHDYYQEEVPFTSVIHASRTNILCLFQSYSFRKRSMEKIDLDKIKFPLSTLCDDLEFLGSLEYLGLKYAVVKNILIFFRNHDISKITNLRNVAQSGLGWEEEIERVRNKVDSLRPNDFITSNKIVGNEDQTLESLQSIFNDTNTNIGKKINQIWYSPV
jgi:glycosyltransferase involved in cell wall biosynthesis